MSYDPEFYYEPSDFEQQVDEFKQSLLNSVRDEFKAELDRLRKENAELQEVKKNMEQMRWEHNRKMQELEAEKMVLAGKVRRERLSELLSSFHVQVYRPNSYWEELPKCDKCNGNRKITFLSPSGAKMHEDCSCRYGPMRYRPESHVCVELAAEGNKMRGWYKPSDYKDYDHYVSADYMEKIYDDVPYEEIPKYWVFFKSEEKCRAYCDWLESKNEQA